MMDPPHINLSNICTLAMKGKYLIFVPLPLNIRLPLFNESRELGSREQIKNMSLKDRKLINKEYCVKKISMCIRSIHTIIQNIENTKVK